MQRETSMRICPYNDQHIIHRDRFTLHILKCAKNFPPKYRETCPFNATHIMPHSELEDHVASCPDKKISGVESYTFAKKHGNIKSQSTSECDELLTCVDTWDGELDNRMKDFDTESIASSACEELMRPPPTYYNSPLKALRPPRGYGLPTMMRFSDDAGDEVESITSSVAAATRDIKVAAMTRSKPSIGRGGVRRMQL